MSESDNVFERYRESLEDIKEVEKELSFSLMNFLEQFLDYHKVRGEVKDIYIEFKDKASRDTNKIESVLTRCQVKIRK